MNTKLLKSVMVLRGDTQETLAKSLGLPQSALSSRIAGAVDFRRAEIEQIAKRYELTAKDIQAIFFTNLVT